MTRQKIRNINSQQKGEVYNRMKLSYFCTSRAKTDCKTIWVFNLDGLIIKRAFVPKISVGLFSVGGIFKGACTISI